jgi:hypothetical protein
MIEIGDNILSVIPLLVQKRVYVVIVLVFKYDSFDLQ